MKENEILKLIMQPLLEHTGREYIQNAEYKKVTKRADLIFQELDDTLNEEQQEQLEKYFVANNEAVAVMERLIYQQGMRDLLNLLISILQKGNEV